MSATRHELRLRLPGRWFALDLSHPDATEQSLRQIAREAVGTADDRAVERAKVRDDLRAAAEVGVLGEARSLLFSTEIAPGTPLPITVAIFEPEKLRMSPAIGTSSDAVLKVMAEALKQLDSDAYASLVTVKGPGVPALRTQFLEPSAEHEGVTRLVVDYWVPVPESKQVLMVRFSSPLGELEHVLGALFDEFISAAYFARHRESSLRDALVGRVQNA